jgi:hypothetical protein
MVSVIEWFVSGSVAGYHWAFSFVGLGTAFTHCIFAFLSLSVSTTKVAGIAR